MLLFLRSLVWTILLPGVVILGIPFLILRHSVFPAEWGFLQWISLPAGTIGVVALLSCIVSFARPGRGTLSPADAPTRLVVRGLYRYVRNPMYCAVILVLLAEAAFFGSASLLAYSGVFFAAAFLFVRFSEEPALRRAFGTTYDAYCQSVHRWLPGRPLDFHE